MEIKKAFEMTVDYYGKANVIKVDNDGYVCLNDMAFYFPNKRLDSFLKPQDTKEFIEILERRLNTDDRRYLKVLKTKRGKYGGGTYAHHLLAFKFATWLSKEFEINVYEAYINGTQRKSDWNIKRILASENFKLMAEAIKDSKEKVMFYDFSNEADLINRLVFGKTKKELVENPRNTASEDQLELISYLEGRNASFIEIGLTFDERKEILSKLYSKKTMKQIDDIDSIDMIEGNK